MVNGDPPSPPDWSSVADRVKSARGRQNERLGIPSGADPLPKSMLGAAMRIGVEMAVAIGGGLGVGLVIDTFAGTRPWGMVAMFMLGAAAGLRNVFRAAGALGMTGATPTDMTGEPPDGTTGATPAAPEKQPGGRNKRT